MLPVFEDKLYSNAYFGLDERCNFNKLEATVGASFEFGETLQNFVDRTCPAGCSRLKCKHKYKVSQAP